jgi:signal transduction histidine kinase
MQLLPGETRKVFVRLSKNSRIGLPPQDLSVVVTDFETGLRSFRRMGTINSIILALLCFIMLYNVFFFIALKEKRYRFYLLSILLIALELARWAGFWSVFLGDWEGTAEFEWNLMFVQNIGLLCTWILMARDFLNLKAYSKRLDRYLMLWFVPAVVGPLYFRFDYYVGSIVAVTLGGLGSMYLLYVVWYSYRKGQPLVGYFSVAVVLYSLFATLNIVHILGWTTGFQTVSLPWRSIGSLIFDSLLSYALGRQYFGLTRDNQEKQNRIIENLHKKNLLQNQLNRATLLYQERTQKEIAQRLQMEVIHLLEGLKERLSGWRGQHPEIIDISSNLIANTLDRLKGISENLMPASLHDPESLQKAIEQILRSVVDVLEVKFSYSHPLEIPEEIRILVCRIVKEVYTNTLKHSESKTLEVEIHQEHPGIVLVFRDNGIGFDPNLENEGHGLRLTRQKLSIYGGDIQIDSAPGRGTSIRVELPLEREMVN